MGVYVLCCFLEVLLVKVADAFLYLLLLFRKTFNYTESTTHSLVVFAIQKTPHLLFICSYSHYYFLGCARSMRKFLGRDLTRATAITRATAVRMLDPQLLEPRANSKKMRLLVPPQLLSKQLFPVLLRNIVQGPGIGETLGVISFLCHPRALRLIQTFVII